LEVDFSRQVLSIFKNIEIAGEYAAGAKNAVQKSATQVGKQTGAGVKNVMQVRPALAVLFTS
jgi:hypothetical protein